MQSGSRPVLLALGNQLDFGNLELGTAPAWDHRIILARSLPSINRPPVYQLSVRNREQAELQTDVLGPRHQLGLLHR